MFLDSTLKSLELVLGSAQTTTAMPITVDYVDLTTTTTTPGASDTQSNGVTAVTILAAPAPSTTRKVNGITIYNADSVAKVVTVRINNNTTLRILISITLNIGETLGYTDITGWYTQDANGNRKVTAVLGGTNVANIWTAQQTFTVSSIVPNLPFNDNSTKEANTAFVQSVEELSMATLPLANITGGTYSFAGLGSGATFTYTVTGSTINSVTSIVSGGTGYAVGDLLLVVGGNYDSVIRVATLSGSAIATVTILYGGTGYSNGTGISTLNALSNPFKIRLAGTLTSNATFILPNGTLLTKSDQYIIGNNTTGAFTVSFFISNGSNAPTGTGVVIPQGTNNNLNTLIETDGVTDVWMAVRTDEIYSNNVTFSTLPAVGTSTGLTYRVTDVGPKGSLWYSNGTNWNPVGGQVVLSQDAIPIGLPPGNGTNTGLQFTNTTGAFTLTTTVFQNAYTGGIWLWMPIGAFDGTNPTSANFYWAIMSTTSAGQLYTATYQAGIPTGLVQATTTAARWLTQTTGADITARSITVTGGVMGPNGMIKSEGNLSLSGSTGTKTIKTKLSSTTFLTFSTAVATSISITYPSTIRNTGVTNSNMGPSTLGLGAGATPIIWSNIDTSVNQTLSFTFQLSSNTDYIILEGSNNTLTPGF